jgi:hypothetical protein
VIVMKGIRLLRATAGLGVAAGVAMAAAASATAAPAEDGEAAAEPLRHQVESAKELRRPKARPAVLKQAKDDEARPWWLMPAPAAGTPAGKRPKILLAQAVGEEVEEAAASQIDADRSDAISPDVPGVLTRAGVLVVEPSIQYQHTNLNRFVVGGVAILDTVLVGSIEATQAKHDAVTGTLGLRYGVTSRFEAELRIPYMYRDDETTNTVVNTNQGATTTSLTDKGLGDIEGALHYQLNDGDGKWPYAVANLRVKSDSGTSPYDVKRDASGIEQELATGSGFWGIEPSLTLIAPSDPAVFYGNVGYLYNVPRDINKQITNSQFIESVSPGGAIRLGFGMGLSLNEKVAFSIGYQHDWIRETKTKFSTGSTKSGSLNVGTVTFGVNWQMSPDTALNVSVGVGVTADAPDVNLMVRVPIAFKLL